MATVAEGNKATASSEIDHSIADFGPLVRDLSSDPTVAPGLDAKEEETIAHNVGENKQRYIIKYFDHPLLSSVEEKVGESFNIMEGMEGSNIIEEQEDNSIMDTVMQQKTLGEHATGIYNTMKDIEQLIVYEKVVDEGEEKTRSTDLPELDAISHASLIGHCLTAYVSTLSESHIKTITSKISSDCQLILTRLFRFPDASVYYHNEEYDGLVKVCKLAVHQKYPKYGTEGFEALYSRPPVIYLSAAAPTGLGQSLCMQLGLPISCISMVPCSTMFGTSSKMDVAMLEKLIQDDIAAAKTPVLLVGYAGTPLIGHIDNLKQLQDICKHHGIWLHVEGNSLAALMLISDPLSVQTVLSADSMTVTLSKWLGISSLQIATLYTCEDTTMTYVAGMNSFNAVSKLSCLPLWICLQSMGHNGIISRIKSSFHLCKLMLDRLSILPNIKIINIDENIDGEKDIVNSDDLTSTTINSLLVYDIPATLIFRYTEISSKTEPEKTPYVIKTSEESSEDEKQIAYYNALNTWLADLLSRENTKVIIKAVNVDCEGVCLRFSPVESAQVTGTSEEDIEDFVLSLQAQIAILDATVSQRKRFQNIVIGRENLMLIEMEGYAGLGAVRYIPNSWTEQLAELPENGKNDINTLNIELVHKLKSTDSAFSLGQSEDGIACVKFGLITAETEIEELVTLVETIGKELEESSKFLETMSERILKGIEEASKDLQRENQERIVQEGLLRQVPLVGSLLNWWSPPAKETVKGRTFNLSSGRIISTETTYKYHMQIQEDGLNSKGQTDQFLSPSSSQSKASSVTEEHVQLHLVPLQLNEDLARDSSTPEIEQSVPIMEGVTSLNTPEQTHHQVATPIVDVEIAQVAEVNELTKQDVTEHEPLLTVNEMRQK